MEQLRRKEQQAQLIKWYIKEMEIKVQIIILLNNIKEMRCTKYQEVELILRVRGLQNVQAFHHRVSHFSIMVVTLIMAVCSILGLLQVQLMVEHHSI